MTFTFSPATGIDRFQDVIECLHLGFAEVGRDDSRAPNGTQQSVQPQEGGGSQV